MPIKIDATSRGFRRGGFTDLYGAECSIQESSLAEKAALWLGCEHETIHSVTGQACGARMHLTQERAAEIAKLLVYFAATGELPEETGG